MDGGRPPGGGSGRSTGDLEPAGQRALVREVDSITAATREFLPDGFQVDASVRDGLVGPQVTLLVQPPVGPPVRTGLRPDVTDGEVTVGQAEREELARTLAARAALQLREVVGDTITPPAR